MKKRLLSLWSLIVVIYSASAQDTLTLHLSSAVNAAIKNNREVLIAVLDQKNAAAQYGQTNAVFLPQVTLSYTAMTTNNPLNAFGFKLQQQSVAVSDFNPVLLNNPEATQNYLTRLEWNQPLLNLDMLYQRKAAEKQIAVFDYKKIRTQEHLTFEVQKAYSQLQLAHHAVTVLSEALTTVNSVYKSSRNYLEQGYIQKSDLLAVQIRVATIESKLEEAKNNVHNASDYLGLLMGVGSGSVYSADPLEITNEAEVSSLIPEDRADFKAFQSAITAQQAIVHSGRMAQMPKLNGFASYVFNDRTALGFGSGSYLVGAQLSWSIFNGTSTFYKTAQQKITLSRMEEQLLHQKEQSQVELNKTQRDLVATQFAILQHQVSVSRSEEALRILQNRFQQGLTSVTELLLAQATLSEQKFLLNETLSKHNTIIAYLKYLTSTSDNK